MNTYAFLIGIDTYDQLDWDDVRGPCANAVAVAKWLISIGVPPSNIHAFFDLMRKLGTIGDDYRVKVSAEVDKLKKDGVQVRCSADSTLIDTFWRAQLPNGCPAGSNLLVYWSGHGCTSSSGNRIFLCRDYTLQLPSRVFNGSNFLRMLKTADYRCFANQIILADVCGVYTHLPIIEGSDNPQQQAVHQLAYYATPEGEYAYGVGDHGLFTETALRVLQEEGGWPDHDRFADRLEATLKEIGVRPFRIAGWGDSAELSETLVGFVPMTVGNNHFRSAWELLSGLDVISDVFLRHYLRTVADLGNPGLLKAQGLIGIVEELSKLRDGTKGVPRGLLQFLARLAWKSEFEHPIGEWLERNAAAQSKTLMEIRRKLALEDEQKILVIVVKIGDRREITYRPYLRNNDLIPVEGKIYEERTVRNWHDFEQSLQPLLTEFTIGDHISNIEIHFLADPPLFDWPFHCIRVTPGDRTIGKEVVVVLRHRRRIFSTDLRLFKAWNEYAASLRPVTPNELKWVKIEGNGAALPTEKGLCFTNFVLRPACEAGGACETEKHIVAALLDIGAPYVYLPHAAPEDDDWLAVRQNLTELLGGLVTLDRFPIEFTNARIRGSDFATQATILWDDPLFNPFISTEGVSVE